MKFTKPFWKRRAISGIIAGILFFALLFTAGVGFLLYINNLNGQFSLAQNQNTIFNQEKSSEAVAMMTGHDGHNNILVWVNNTGGSSVAIISAFLTDDNGALVPLNQMLNSTKIIKPFNSTVPAFSSSRPFALDLTGKASRIQINTSETATRPFYNVGIITKAGNVFTAPYPPLGAAGAGGGGGGGSPVLPGIVGTLNSSVASPGNKVYDQATLAGVTPTATGSVTYSYYTPSSNICDPSSLISQQVVSISGTTVPNSAPVLFSTPGLYSWNVIYSGDTNNGGATGACQPLLVTTASGVRTALVTTLSANTIIPPDSVYDQATLTGVTSTAGGAVTYYRYSDGFCSAGQTQGGAVTVSSGIVPNSNPVAFTAAGVYSWNAVYSGDGNNSPSTSACEPLLATSSTVVPALDTVLSASVVSPGASVFDQALLTGATPTAGGTVTFYYYSTSGICASGQAQVGSPVAVVNGVVTSSSNSVTFNAAGTYSWSATYSGDANNQAASSPCEPLLVTRTFVPALVTTLSANVILPGSSVFDQATLAGVTNDAGGTVTYYRYTASPTCQGTRVQVSQVAVANGKVGANSSSVAYPSPGSFSWSAVYSGDANNNPAASTCEPLYVTRNYIRAVLTTLSSNAVNPGGSVFDQATLTGVTTNAGGTVTYYRYADGICTLTQTQVGATKTVTNGIVPNSDPFTFNSAGTFSWSAAYSGDANNTAATSPCEPLLVEPKFVTQIVTTLSSSVVAPVTQVFDQASLTGVTTTAGGTVTYYRYSNGICTTGQTQVGAAKTVTNGVAPNSDPFTFNSAGKFSWNAVYSGDLSNNGVTSPCEPLLVTNLNYITSIITTLSTSSAPTSTAVYDQSTLTGVTTKVGGTVTYYRYADGACTLTQTQVGAVKTVTNGVAPNSDPFTFTIAGSYGWKATYSGDANNTAATSSCEPLSITAVGSTASRPGLITTLSKNVVSPGGSVFDQATLAGVSASAGGTVTYYLYTTPNSPVPCSGSRTAEPIGGVAVTNGKALNSTAVQFNTPANFYWVAVYSGDANNNPATSACEPLLVQTPPCQNAALCTASNSLTTQGIGFIGFNFDHFISLDMGVCDVLSQTASAHEGCASPLPNCWGTYSSPACAANQYSGYQVKPQQHFMVFVTLLTNVDPSGRTLVLVPPTTSGVGGGSERSTGGTAFLEFTEPSTGGGNINSWSYSLVASVNESGSGGGSGTGACTATSTCIEPLRTATGNPLNAGGVVLPPITCFDGVGGTGNIVSCTSSTALSFVTHPTWVYFAAAFNEVNAAAGSEPGRGNPCTSPCVVGNFLYLQGLIGGHSYGQNIPLETTLWSTQTVSATSVVCSPSPRSVGLLVTCTATVSIASGTSPTGVVIFSTSEVTGATWTPSSATCTLAFVSATSASCSVSYTQSVAGTPTITASYTGDANNLASGGQTTVTFA